jgi:hypothetical protein
MCKNRSVQRGVGNKRVSAACTLPATFLVVGRVGEKGSVLPTRGLVPLQFSSLQGGLEDSFLAVTRYTECFKKIFTTLKAYRNLYRGHTQGFELSKSSKTHRVLQIGRAPSRERVWS